MRLQIRATPTYLITFSAAEIRTLMKFSACHYDGLCESASRVGGFLYGWDNGIQYQTQVTEEQYICRASRHQLDLICKILEIGDALPDFEVVKDVARTLRRAVAHGESVCSKLTIGFDDYS